MDINLIIIINLITITITIIKLDLFKNKDF